MIYGLGTRTSPGPPVAYAEHQRQPPEQPILEGGKHHGPLRHDVLVLVIRIQLQRDPPARDVRRGTFYHGRVHALRVPRHSPERR